MGGNINQRFPAGPPRPQHLRLDNSGPHHDISGTMSNGSPAQQRLDSLVGNNLPPEPPERVSSFAVMSSTLRSPVTNNDYMNSSHHNSSHHNTSSSHLMNSSYNMGHSGVQHNSVSSHSGMNNINTSAHDSNNNPNNNSTPVTTTPSKRVSFQDTSVVSQSPPSPQLEKIREDPNVSQYSLTESYQWVSIFDVISSFFFFSFDFNTLLVYHNMFQK